MKIKILIGLCMILLFSSLANAWCVFWVIGDTCDINPSLWDTKGATEEELRSAIYTATTKTILNNVIDGKGNYTKTFYGNTQFVEEDNKWKHYTEARSLKGKGFKLKYLKDDGINDFELGDFNATYIELKPYVKDLKQINKDIPIKINDVQVTTTKITSLDSKSSFEYTGDVFSRNFTIGEHSTTVKLVGNTTDSQFTRVVESGEGNDNNDNFGITTSLLIGRAQDNGHDLYGLYRNNLTEIPSDTNLTAVNLTFYRNSATGRHGTIDIKRFNIEWFEGDKDNAVPDVIEGSTWNERKAIGNVAWTGGTDGGFSDTIGNSIGSSRADGTIKFIEYNNVDLMMVAQGWINGSYTNYGVYLYNDTVINNWIDIYSNDDVSGLNPVLTLTYTSNTAPVLSDIGDFDKDEDFTEFTIDWSDNISDAEDSDADLKFHYSLNDTSLFSLAINNATNIATFTNIANKSGVVNVSITIEDTGGLTDFDSFDFIINEVNDNPWMTNLIIADLNVNEDFGANIDLISISDLQANFSDVEDNNNPSTITLVSENNTGVVDCLIDGSNNLECDSVTNAFGSSHLVIQMDDSGGLNTSFSLDIIVSAVNDNPTRNAGFFANITGIEDDPIIQNVVLIADINSNWTDVEDATPTTYEIISQNDTDVCNCIFDGSNNIDCTPLPNASGINVITFSANDSGGLSVEWVFQIYLSAVNDLPWWDMIDNSTITITEDTATQNTPINISIYFWDVENINDGNFLFMNTNETDVTCTESGVAIKCSPTNNFTGLFTLEVEGDDGVNPTITINYEAEVTAIDDTPWFDEITNGSLSIIEDTASQNSPADASIYYWDVEDIHTWSSISISDNETDVTCIDNGVAIECSPVNNFTGLFIINLDADDGTTHAYMSYEVDVINVNDNPWIEALNDITMNEDNGTSIIYLQTDLNNSFRDIEDDNNPTTTVIFSETNTTLINCSIVAYNLQCVTGANHSGYSDITLNYTDSGGLSVTDTFRITVSAVNDAPTIPIRSPLIYTSNFSFNGECSGSFDVEGDLINYEFYLDTNNPPTTLRQNSTDTTYSINTLANDTYYFRCKANDNLSNSGYTSVTTYDIDNTAIWNYTVSYTSSAIEGGDYNYYINITVNNLSNFVTDVERVYLEYNGFNYLMTETSIPGSNNYGFYKTGITTPFGSSSESFLFNITSKYYNNSYAFDNTQNFTQTISLIYIYDCGGVTNATSSMIYNFTLWGEFLNNQFNQTENTSFDIDFEMRYYKDDPNNYKNLTITADNSTNLTICISPADASYNHTSIIDYGGQGYDRRQYYFIRDNFKGGTLNSIPLYLLDVSKATSPIDIIIKNADGVELEGYYSKIKKKFIGTGTYETIGMLKSNDDGKDSIYLQQDEPLYKFIIMNSLGTIVAAKSDTKITETSINIVIGAVSLGDIITTLKDTSGTLSFDNATRTFNLVYSKKDNNVEEICLKVVKHENTGQTQQGTILCSSNTDDTLSRSVSGLGVFSAYAYQTIKSETTIEDGETVTKDLDYKVEYPLASLTYDDHTGFSSVIGTEGLVVAIFLILTISLVMIWSPSAAVAASLLGLIIVMIMGLINVGWGSIIGLIIIGIFLIVRLKH